MLKLLCCAVVLGSLGGELLFFDAPVAADHVVGEVYTGGAETESGEPLDGRIRVGISGDSAAIVLFEGVEIRDCPNLLPVTWQTGRAIDAPITLDEDSGLHSIVYGTTFVAEDVNQRWLFFTIFFEQIEGVPVAYGVVTSPECNEPTYFILYAGVSTPTVTPRPTWTPTSVPTPTPTHRPPTAVPSNTPMPSVLIGDTNCDGLINAIDATLILQYTAGLLGLLPCHNQGDTNADGRVSALDAALVLQYAAGLLDRLGTGAPVSVRTDTPRPPTDTPTRRPTSTPRPPTNTVAPTNTPRPMNTPTTRPTNTPTPIDVAALVNQWDNCVEAWSDGYLLEGEIGLTRSTGGDLSYLLGQFDIVWEFLQTDCLGIGRLVGSVAGNPTNCLHVLGKGSLYSSFRELGVSVGFTTFSLDFALQEVDDFIFYGSC